MYDLYDILLADSLTLSTRVLPGRFPLCLVLTYDMPSLMSNWLMPLSGVLTC